MGPVTQCLVENRFSTNFSISSKTCDTVFRLESFLHEFQYFKQDVLHSVWLRIVFTLILVFQERRGT